MSKKLSEIYQELLSTEKKNGAYCNPTGLTCIDNEICGFYPGELAVLTGAPRSGKTALMLRMALNLAYQGYGVYYYSPAIYKWRLLKRIFGMVCDKDIESVEDVLTNTNNRYTEKMQDIFDLPFFVNDRLFTPKEIEQDILQHLKNYKPAALFIDDFNSLVVSANLTPSDSIEQHLNKLKQIAQKAEVPVIVSYAMRKRTYEDFETYNFENDHDYISYAVQQRFAKYFTTRNNDLLDQYADKLMHLYRPEIFGHYENEEGEYLFNKAYLYIEKNDYTTNGYSNEQYFDNKKKIRLCFIKETADFKCPCIDRHDINCFCGKRTRFDIGWIEEDDSPF